MAERNEWTDVVLPVLQEMHDAEIEGRPSRAEAVLVERASSEEHAQETARRIRDEDLARPIWLGSDGRSLHMARLTANGKRAVGQWSEGAMQQAMAAILADLAERVDDEDDRSAIRRAAAKVGTFTAETFRAVLGAYLGRQIPPA